MKSNERKIQNVPIVVASRCDAVPSIIVAGSYDDEE